MTDVKAACEKWAAIRGHYPNPGPQFEQHMGQFLEWVEADAKLRAYTGSDLDAPHTEADSIASKAVVMLQEQGISGMTVHTAARSIVAFTLAELAQRQSVPVRVRFDVAAEEAGRVFNDAGLGGDGLHCLRVLMDYLSAHAVIDAPMGVPSEPTPEQVEALARVLVRQIQADGGADEVVLARAAFAHIQPDRPNGPPRRRERGTTEKAGCNNG